MELSRKDHVLTDAGTYFASYTHACDVQKLSALLYLFDLEHFRQTGPPATAAKYIARRDGPFIPGLQELLSEQDARAASFLRIDSDAGLGRPLVKSLRQFSSLDMTPRHLSILTELANAHADSFAEEIVAQALRTAPAYQTLLVGPGEQMVSFPFVASDPTRYATMVA